jgi:cyclic dehypoxanthinyl futalosine synthase
VSLFFTKLNYIRNKFFNVNTVILLQKALNLDFLSMKDGLHLYQNAPTSELMAVANEIRKKINPGNKVGWIIDRNVNITNICTSGCLFCNFYRSEKSGEAYLTTTEEYRQKIDETFASGGEQLLLQGGLHPKLGLGYYTKLFSGLKSQYPNLKLHALGPPEIAHIAKLEGKSFSFVLKSLVEAGLDSLPGAGAEILSDRVRNIVSKQKCSVGEWLDVMREAHKLGLITSTTMMFGHVETMEERIEHLIKLRQVQIEKPENSVGFISFTPWPFQDENTTLQKRFGVTNETTADDYLRLLAISRIMLPNIPHIQASWLTIGKDVAQMCLHGGADDFGSIMIEENVVSVAGATYAFDAEGIQRAIREAGFVPYQRDQRYANVNSTLR